MKKGDKLLIHCYKHNGRLHKTWSEAVILDVKKDHIVLGNYNTLVTKNDGRKWTTNEPAILFYYFNKWYNVIAQIKPFGLFYYCNIASPIIIDDGIIKYIDYDLDLRVFPDGSFKILDRNEYNYHKKIMNYSKDIDFVIRCSLTELINLKKSRSYPFNKNIINKYFNEFKKIEKNIK